MIAHKTVLVTGSTSGIGQAIAESFAHHNANVILNGLDTKENNSALIEKMSMKTKGIVDYLQLDVSNPSAIQEAMGQLIERYGAVDILINNAGIQHVSPIEEFPVAKWDQIIALNLTSAFHTTRLLLPKMREKKWGRIINIASVHGLVASANKSAYVAAKHGIIGLTKVIALETARENITCNAICPGWVLTPLVHKQIIDKAEEGNISLDESTEKLLGEKQPSLSFVRPGDIGKMAVFLCSPDSEQLTGAAIPIDGAWTSQ